MSSPQKTSVDWFAFRSKDSPDVFASELSDSFGGYELFMQPRKSGWMGFERSADLMLKGAHIKPGEAARIGLIATGGDAVRGWSMCSLSGVGCAFVSDWEQVMERCSGLDSFELKRVDIALDRYDGSHFAEVQSEWASGGFSPVGAGRPPRAKVVADAGGAGGSTFYVGTRRGAKFYRGYEKGFQFIERALDKAKTDEEAFDAVTQLMRCVDENGRSCMVDMRDWWRDEVEFKPVKCTLPLDIVECRDAYFAGAYPYLSRVLPDVEGHVFIKREVKVQQLLLSQQLENIRRQYGTTLFTAMMAYEGDISAVWDKIVGDHHNKRLLDAGVMLVEHV